MITSEESCELSTRIVALAKMAGADAADAIASASTSESVTVRLGNLEDVERSEDEEIGLRVFVGKKSASVSGSDFSDSSLKEMAERAVAMAKLAPDDPYAGLAAEGLLASGPFPDFDLVDASEPTPARLREIALETEDSARAIKGVSNSAGASAGYGHSVSALATSNGFVGGYAATSSSISASMIAGEGDNMQRDYEYRVMRHAEDLPSAAGIGVSAGERAVAKLDPVRLPSGPMAVVFDPRVGNSLIGHLLGAINGMSIARKSSFLLDRLGEQIFAPSISICDEPHRIRGMRSKPFDGEGLPTAPSEIVRGGQVTGWLLNCAAARQLELLPNGHAARGGGGSPGISASNVHLEPGALSQDQLIGEITDGVFVTELIGQGVNGITGDYSRAAAGFRIRNGQLAESVSEFTIAGNLLDMFAQLTPASDLEMYRAVNVPTLRVDGMTIAGE